MNRLETAECDVQNAKATVVSAADELSRLRGIERDVSAEIAGAQSQSKNLISNLKSKIGVMTITFKSPCLHV